MCLIGVALGNIAIFLYRATVVNTILSRIESIPMT